MAIIVTPFWELFRKWLGNQPWPKLSYLILGAIIKEEGIKGQGEKGFSCFSQILSKDS
jgi:hypothetical protein